MSGDEQQPVPVEPRIITVTEPEMEEIITRAVNKAMFRLTGMSVETSEDREKLRADFNHLRRWRKAVDKVGDVGLGTAVKVLVTGALGALFVGAAYLFTKHG